MEIRMMESDKEKNLYKHKYEEVEDLYNKLLEKESTRI